MEMPQTLLWPVPEPRGALCAVTMAKDDHPFLRQFIAHHARLLPGTDIVVIDDASDPPLAAVAAEFPEVSVSVLRLPAGGYSAGYKAAALSAMAGILTDRYAWVFCGDVDEMLLPLVPSPLADLLAEVPDPIVAPLGLLIVEHPSEGPFDFARPLRAQRRYACTHSASTKPCLWSGERAMFTPGQHSLTDGPAPLCTTIGVAHLKYVDLALAEARQRVRAATDFSAARKPNQGVHWMTPPEKTRELPMVRRVATAGRYLDLDAAIAEFLAEACEDEAGAPVPRGRFLGRALDLGPA